MNASQRNRLWFVSIIMILVTGVVIARLVQFMVLERDETSERALSAQQIAIKLPHRGIIYDRHGAVLAANGADYQIGVSPNLVENPAELATALAPILDVQQYTLLAKLQTSAQYALLSGRVSPQIAEAIRALPYSDQLQIEPMARRFYPQGTLLGHTLGFSDLDNRGGSGLEGYYDRELAGEKASQRVNLSPLAVNQQVEAREGADLVLTIDRSLQFLVERHLREALATYESPSGEIIIMDPKTGALLAMAAEPGFDPYYYYNTAEDRIINPIISKQFEPGSVMKLITMAAALDSGTVTPASTYYDSGELYVGGHRTVNWTRLGHGTVDMTTLLGQSLNVGAATLALWMGADTFYDYLQRFGFGQPTGIDLMAEASGQMPLPGDPFWDESMLATNSYGQSIAVTPIQMITAVAALANEGKMMQPYVVAEIHRGNNVFQHEPVIISQPVSKETAQQVTAMAANAISGVHPEAQLAGFALAGKTGTAEIAENGFYLEDKFIGTFVGWFPLDNPEVIVYVKLDKPNIPWGSQTAAPTFVKLAQEMVVLLDIPPDDIRLQGEVLAARGTE